MSRRNVVKRPRPSGRGYVGALSLLGMFVLSGGCMMVGPKYQAPDVSVHAAWRGADDPRIKTKTAVDSAWWRSFDDPVLDRLIELAFQQNLSLQTAGLVIIEARARLAVAAGRQYPQVQAALGSVALVGVPTVRDTGPAVDRHFADLQVGFDAVWELDFWGKYRQGVNAEAASMLASVADYYAALVALTAEVARTYAAVRTFEVLLANAEEHVRLHQQALEIADSRFRNGATSELDVAQATSLFESTRASIPPLRTGLQQAQNALGTLLVQPPSEIVRLLAGPTAIPKAPATVAVGVPAEMLRRRPDIRSAELRAMEQCARVGIAQAQLYPSFSLFGTVGLHSTNVSGSSLNPFSLSNIFYMLGLRVHLPIFNYGRLENLVRVEDAKLEQLLVGYREAVINAAQEAEDAMAAFLYAQDATVFSEAAVAAAERSVEIALTQYREGAVDFQRVLDAERSLVDEENTLVQSRSAIATNLIALYKALGGGWEVRTGERIVPSSTEDRMRRRTNWGDDPMFAPPLPKPATSPGRK